MFSSFWPGRAFRRSLAMALGAACAMALPAAQAAPADETATLQAPTWAQAAEDAWLRSPAGRAWGPRQAQVQAGRDAASSWLADAPALTLLERNDRWHDRRGQREWEAELDLPLRLPGMRHALQATALAQAEAAQAHGAADRLAVAGEVREAGWALRLAGIDVEAARLRVDEAQALARDVARRVSAGDLARVDAHRAQAAVHQAQAALARAEAALLRARSAFQALTGHADAPLEDEPPAGGEAVQGFAAGRRGAAGACRRARRSPASHGRAAGRTAGAGRPGADRGRPPGRPGPHRRPHA